MRSLKV